MHQDIFEFFKSFNVPILELYGLTECSGMQSINFTITTESKPGFCGQQLKGVKAKIKNFDGHKEVK